MRYDPMTMDLSGGPVRERELPVLPLPQVVDTPAVVLLGFMLGSGGPVVLDASDVREVQPTAAPLLLALLSDARQAGHPARLSGAPAALRRRLAAHPLAAFLEDDKLTEDERIFVCPDRDDVGFQPSLR